MPTKVDKEARKHALRDVLRRLREDANYTWQFVAQKATEYLTQAESNPSVKRRIIGYKSMRQYSKGKNYPSKAKLNAIGQVFGLDLQAEIEEEMLNTRESSVFTPAIFGHLEAERRPLPADAEDPNLGVLRSPDAAMQGDLFRRFDVEDIEAGKLFLDKPLRSDHLLSEYHDVWIDYPDEIQMSFVEELRRAEQSKQDHGLTLDNNGTYSLRRIDVSRPEGKDGERDNIYKLHLYPSDYYHFVFPNLCLERKELNYSTRSENTIREITGLTHEKLRFSNLENLPYHFRVGTGTVILTRDGYAVGSLRSKRQFVVPSRGNEYLSLHVSAAEGMYRSTSTGKVGDIIDDMPSPFATCVRALSTELNIFVGRHFSMSDVGCLGYVMDRSRAQPLFVFVLQAREMMIDDVFSCWFESPNDQHENEDIIGLRWDVENILKLFSGPRIEEVDYVAPTGHEIDFGRFHAGKRFRLSSNHAEAGFLLALRHHFGASTLIHATM